MKYYRTDKVTYAQRAALADQAEGFPNGRADTALPDVNSLPTDQENRVYLPMSSRYYNNAKYASLFAGIDEVTQAQYEAIL